MDKPFTCIQEELDYLKNHVEEGHLTVSETNQIIRIDIQVTNCLTLVFAVQRSAYPSFPPTKICLEISAHINNTLKLGRKYVVDEFLSKCDNELNALVDSVYSHKPCVVHLYEKAKEILEREAKINFFLFETFNILQSTPQSTLNSVDYEPTATKSKSKSKQQNPSNVSTQSNSKFRGADVIFQRLKWDPDIQRDQVVIGYLDRFLGIKEIKFNEFKGVHDDRDGVPLHRIRYFKINNTIVWDREQKLDILTGSGDNLSKFFVEKHTEEYVSIPEPLAEHRISPDCAPLSDSIYLRYQQNKWQEKEACELVDKEPEFIGNFKLLTYNILSKHNFKLSLSGNKECVLPVGLCNIDRMVHIINLLEKNQPEFVLLQECENYELTSFFNSPFIQKSYIISQTIMNSSGLVILSKQPFEPILVKQLKLSKNSSKLALIAKFKFRIESLRKSYDILIVNIHLTSNKAYNAAGKRQEQLRTLKEYLTGGWEELACDYLFLAGDFNSSHQQDQKSDGEDQLIGELFPDFVDLLPNDVNTFDARVNFCANLTSSDPKKAQRYDRVLFKRFTGNESQLIHSESKLVNTAPFKISGIQASQFGESTSDPYLNFKKHADQNEITINNDVKRLTEELQNVEIEEGQLYLHPSDHFGLELSFKLKNSLSQSNVVHKSTLAVLLPYYLCETSIVEPVRQKFDPQYIRWPAHLNLLYPFYSELSDQDIGNVYADIISCLNRIESFECELDKINWFTKNQVIFLEPSSSDTKKKFGQLYSQLKRLFEGKNKQKKESLWRDELSPHCTIAQPENKAKAPKNWYQQTYDTIKSEFPDLVKNISIKFKVDTVYWLSREDNTPFRIRQAFPIGLRYPAILNNLNPVEFSPASRSVLKYLHDIGVLIDQNELSETHKRVSDEIQKSIKTLFNCVNVATSTDSVNFSFEMRDQQSDISYYLLPVGSFMHGIFCNDLDLSLIRVITNKTVTIQPLSEFSANLTYQLAQNASLFRIARSINDAVVPIIELCLEEPHSKFIQSIDIQVFEVYTKPHDDSIFYDNLEFMTNLSSKESEYSKIFPISGVFENQNLKKLIPDFKDYQVLISFVKHWAKLRHIYGKAFGYLGGISWSILVVFYLRNISIKKERSSASNISVYGQLVAGFFRYYTSWNWFQAVAVVQDSSLDEAVKRFHQKSAMMILQTVFPYHNTSKNVTSQSRSVIKTEIERASKIFDSVTDLYEACQICCEPLNPTSEKYILQFEIICDNSTDLGHIFTLIKAKTQGFVTSLERNLTGNVELRPYTGLEQVDSVHTYSIGLNCHLLTEDKRSIISEYAAGLIRNVKNMSHASNFKIEFKILG